MTIKVNPDKDKANIIRKAIAKNSGYCPCRVDKTPETKCICKEFEELNENGWCYCGLYYKEI